MLTMNVKPVARSAELLLERIGDEAVAYDTKSKAAHCLSPLACAVFELCDGQTSVAELATAVSQRLGEPVDAARVLDALAQLEERDLLVASASPGGTSRRELLGRGAKIGAVAVTVPLITTIVAPTASAAVTPTCGDILCCACAPSPSEAGQPCCIHPTAIQCNCTAKESGSSCKQCKPQGPAASDVRCKEFFPSTSFPGFPEGAENGGTAPCPCSFDFARCCPPGFTPGPGVDCQ
jgi:hypothetical protein